MFYFLTDRMHLNKLTTVPTTDRICRYWQNKPLWGFGMGAASYIQGTVAMVAAIAIVATVATVATWNV